MSNSRISAVFAFGALTFLGACGNAGASPNGDRALPSGSEAVVEDAPPEVSLGRVPVVDKTAGEVPVAEEAPIPESVIAATRGEPEKASGADVSEDQPTENPAVTPCLAIEITGPTFVSGSAGLTAAGRDLLRTQYESIAGRECEGGGNCGLVARVDAHGHTDPHPAVVGNQTLSDDRAQSVLSYLETLGAPAGQALGFADSDPTGLGDEADRRVVLIAHCENL